MRGASYGVKGTKTRTHCATHGKPLGLVNVINPRCQEQGCNVLPSYGEGGTKNATHCAPHGKLLGLVDVVSRRCQEPGCDVRASYGEFTEQGTKSLTHCAEHRKPELLPARVLLCYEVATCACGAQVLKLSARVVHLVGGASEQAVCSQCRDARGSGADDMIADLAFQLEWLKATSRTPTGGDGSVGAALPVPRQVLTPGDLFLSAVRDAGLQLVAYVGANKEWVRFVYIGVSHCFRFYAEVGNTPWASGYFVDDRGQPSRLTFRKALNEGSGGQFVLAATDDLALVPLAETILQQQVADAFPFPTSPPSEEEQAQSLPPPMRAHRSNGVAAGGTRYPRGVHPELRKRMFFFVGACVIGPLHNVGLCPAPGDDGVEIGKGLASWSKKAWGRTPQGGQPLAPSISPATHFASGGAVPQQTGTGRIIPASGLSAVKRRRMVVTAHPSMVEGMARFLETEGKFAQLQKQADVLGAQLRGEEVAEEWERELLEEDVAGLAEDELRELEEELLDEGGYELE